MFKNGQWHIDYCYWDAKPNPGEANEGIPQKLMIKSFPEKYYTTGSQDYAESGVAGDAEDDETPEVDDGATAATNATTTVTANTTVTVEEEGETAEAEGPAETVEAESAAAAVQCFSQNSLGGA